MGSGLRLRRSIRKYGEENHKKEILEFFKTRELLIEAEKQAITPEMVNDANCMNLKPGGSGGFKDREHMLKCSTAGGKIHKEKIINNEEYRKKVIEVGTLNLMNYLKSGKHNFKTFTGKKHSDETKKLMSEKAKNRTIQQHSQYGTCWITREGVNKKIKKEELESYLNERWIQGRKC
jgi:hypothetical protein